MLFLFFALWVSFGTGSVHDSRLHRFEIPQSLTLNPKPLNPKPLNPKPLNPEPGWMMYIRRSDLLMGGIGVYTKDRLGTQPQALPSTSASAFLFCTVSVGSSVFPTLEE